jgi:hypothetical protein
MARRAAAASHTIDSHSIGTGTASHKIAHRSSGRVASGQIRLLLARRARVALGTATQCTRRNDSPPAAEDRNFASPRPELLLLASILFVCTQVAVIGFSGGRAMASVGRAVAARDRARGSSRGYVAAARRWRSTHALRGYLGAVCSARCSSCAVTTDDGPPVRGCSSSSSRPVFGASNRIRAAR